MCETGAFFVSVAKKIHLILIWLAAMAAFSGCNMPLSAETSSPQQIVVEDDLGRAVRLPGKVVRAISLAPSVTETIFAAGAGDRLVGVTTYCNYPEAAKSVEKVGDTQTPNIERIIALKPQVVFVSTASQLEAFAETLERQNVSVYVTNAADLRGVLRNIRAFGTIFGTEQIAEAAATDIERRTVAVEGRIRGALRPRVFVQISEEPLFTVGSGSFLTEIVRIAGGESVTKDVATAYPKLSKETAFAMRPDVILLSDSDDNKRPNPVFASSPAVRTGRVYRINADIISRPGPRLIEALEQIERSLRGKN